jgi:hypothetical protein
MSMYDDVTLYDDAFWAHLLQVLFPHSFLASQLRGKGLQPTKAAARGGGGGAGGGGGGGGGDGHSSKEGKGKAKAKKSKKT